MNQEEVLKRWIEQYKPLVYKVVNAYGDTTEERQDLFQEITIQLWRSISSFRGDSAESTWVYRVALNTAMKWTTKERKYTTNNTALDHSSYLAEIESPKDERLSWLYRQIRTMEEVDRSLALLLLDGYSYTDMSELLGISVSNVGVKIHRIKDRLTREVQKLQENEF